MNVVLVRRVRFEVSPKIQTFFLTRTPANPDKIAVTTIGSYLATRERKLYWNDKDCGVPTDYLVYGRVSCSVGFPLSPLCALLSLHVDLYARLEKQYVAATAPFLCNFSVWIIIRRSKPRELQLPWTVLVNSLEIHDELATRCWTDSAKCVCSDNYLLQALTYPDRQSEECDYSWSEVFLRPVIDCPSTAPV